MAEEKELDQSKKKSKTMLIVIIVVVVNLAIGGVVVAVMMSGGGEKAAAAQPAGGGGGAAPVMRASGEGPGPIIEMDNFVVNIQSDEGSKYLKAAIVVELGDSSVQDIFSQWKPLVRNEVLVFLSSLEVAETITVKQKRLVENRLKGIINKRVGSDIVVGVYFTEFVTQ
jgi:flagellar protein FliL